MATRTLALKLGHLENVSISEQSFKSNTHKQIFNYLMVLDFEATCWDDHRGRSEIIEFPVVFYDVHKRKILDEFQQYVMPEECPTLSEFCRQLTGIKQEQVENGVPLKTCFMLFMEWLKGLRVKYNFYFPNEKEYKGSKKCIFVTWTDWDLGLCLRNECRRKHISKPRIFSCWIDLQLLYKELYKRNPKGLNGAITELGMNFIGRQHCGLDDARNTAYLARRMMDDGILLRMTKSTIASIQAQL